jgi:hypothetical protein
VRIIWKQLSGTVLVLKQYQYYRLPSTTTSANDDRRNQLI